MKPILWGIAIFQGMVVAWRTATYIDRKYQQAEIGNWNVPPAQSWSWYDYPLKSARLRSKFSWYLAQTAFDMIFNLLCLSFGWWSAFHLLDILSNITSSQMVDMNIGYATFLGGWTILTLLGITGYLPQAIARFAAKGGPK